MCTAFVNGIEATNTSATTPWVHHVAKCALEVSCAVIPSALNPRPAAQPTGDHFSNERRACVRRNASGKERLKARENNEPEDGQLPTTEVPQDFAAASG